MLPARSQQRSGVRPHSSIVFGNRMSKPPRIREEAAVRRQQIIDEAIRLIGLKGYHGFTIQELAHRCGITNGAVLYYFVTKEGLLIAVLEEQDRHEAESLPSMMNIDRDASQSRQYAAATVASLLRAIIKHKVSEPELALFRTVLQSEALNPAHPAHAHFMRREAMILSKFRILLTGHVEDPAAAARCVLSLIEGFTRQWFMANRKFDLLAEWDKAMALALPLVGVREEAGVGIRQRRRR